MYLLGQELSSCTKELAILRLLLVLERFIRSDLINVEVYRTTFTSRLEALQSNPTKSVAVKAKKISLILS